MGNLIHIQILIEVLKYKLSGLKKIEDNNITDAYENKKLYGEMLLDQVK